MDNPFLPIPQQQSAPQAQQKAADNPFMQIPTQGASPMLQDIGDQSFNNLCEKFAEEAVYGKSGMFPTAADAWNTYAQNGQAKPGLAGIKPNSLIYFAPDASNGGFGHVGVYAGDGKMVSATYNGVQESSLPDWVQSTKQQILGYIPVGKGAN